MKWNLQWHFQLRHPKDLVSIPGEGVYQPYRLCGMQMSPWPYGHEQSAMCGEGELKKLQRETFVDSVLEI